MNQIIELIKYGFWGGISTAINIIIFVVLENMGVNYILSNTIGYIIAVIFNFIFNNKFVFKDSKADNRALIKFISLRTISLGTENLLFFVLVSIFNVNIYISKIFISILIITFTYIISKRFVFSRNGGRNI